MPASRYYKRRRALPVLDTGTGALSDPVPAMTTRYYFGVKRRKPHNVYYVDGLFFRVRNVVTATAPDGTPCAWTHALVPIGCEVCADLHLPQTLEQGRAAPVTLHIEAGRIVRAVGAPGTPYEGATVLDGTEPDDYIEELLDLKPGKRPMRAA